MREVRTKPISKAQVKGLVFTCILIYTVWRLSLLIYANRSDMLISVGVCIVRMRFFAFWYFESEAHSTCIVCLCWHCQQYCVLLNNVYTCFPHFNNCVLSYSRDFCVWSLPVFTRPIILVHTIVYAVVWYFKKRCLTVFSFY